MTFSDKRVAEVVNSKFVAAWVNRGAGFVNAEFWTEKGIADRNYEAYPTKNICTFFLTPEGKVFYYVAGSYSPELFVKILETALSLRKILFDEKMELREKGPAEAARYHEDLAGDYEDLQLQAERPGGWQSLVKKFQPVSYRKQKHVHSESCSWSLKNGYEYLTALHKEWMGRKELPAFDDVRYLYLYGNDFTEETADSKHVVRPEPPAEQKAIARRLRAQQAEAKGDKDLFGIDTPAKGVNLFGQ